uniref:Cysteine-rich protein 1 n=7 Tax=Meloidogyne TaxID=189290 RepID=A0A915M796_MELJA
MLCGHWPQIPSCNSLTLLTRVLKHNNMPDCPTCNRPVYFAERVTSIGKDWHRPCLRCYNQACKKTLSAGGHSEHEGKPYCNRCYGALFGPRGYGHGGVESHVFLGGTTGGTRASVTGQ